MHAILALEHAHPRDTLQALEEIAMQSPSRRRPPFLRRNLIELLRHLNERTDKLIGLLAVLLLASVLLNLVHPTPMKDWVELVLGVAHLFVATLLILYGLSRRFLKDPTRLWALALSNEDCSKLRGWLRGTTDPDLKLTGCLYEYVSDKSMDALVRMNYDGFRNTAWAIDEEKLKKRNPGWLARNPKIFMLMLDPIGRKEYIGYSCLLPLNAGGADLYLAGKLNDEEIPAELIAAPQEKTAAVLIFAIVLRPEFSLARSGASKMYSLYFWSCILQHAVDLYGDLQGSSGCPPLYAQSERRRIVSRLKSFGFANTGLATADGFDLWKLENPFQVPGTQKGPAPVPPRPSVKGPETPGLTDRATA